MRFVEKVIAIAQRLLCVLIDRDRDCLNVLVAIALSRGPLPQFSKRVDPGRVVSVLVVPFERLCHYQLRPPSTRPFIGPSCSSLSRSRSSQRPSIFQHPLQQKFSRCGRDADALKLQDFLTLSSDLDAHVLDFGTDVI
jgi:hypothetical protein